MPATTSNIQDPQRVGEPQHHYAENNNIRLVYVIKCSATYMCVTKQLLCYDLHLALWITIKLWTKSVTTLQNKRFLQNFSDIPEDGTISVPKRVGCVQFLTDIDIG
jgi:hypothetical protein